MFLNYIKEFFVKRKLKKSFQIIKNAKLTGTIKTVGLLIDESRFSEKKALINELLINGVLEENIEVIVYKDGFGKRNNDKQTSFGSKHLNWNAIINNTSVNDFVAKEFDLLISYYDIEKAILLLVTYNSNAKFKVGFSSIDKRINNLIINTSVEKHKVFIQELFRYLKILNKI